MIIAHDPGHGYQPRPGGCSHNGINERDLVLLIATDIAAGIPWANHCLLRRCADGPSYTDRAQTALKLGARLVLCHHINSVERQKVVDGKPMVTTDASGVERPEMEPDPTAHGLITFFDAGDVVGEAVARAIAAGAPPKLHRDFEKACFPASPNDWTVNAHWVLEHYRCLGLPAVLIEWGFATNQSDAAVLLNPLLRPQLVTAAAAGIARAIEVTHVTGEDLTCHG